MIPFRGHVAEGGRGEVFAAVPGLTGSQRRRLSFQGYSRPLSLSIETVNICQNNCVICSYSTQERKGRVMPMDLFQKVLGDYGELGGGNLSLTPLVGEVLLDGLLPQRLTVIKMSKAVKRLSATTNAVGAGFLDDVTLAYIVSAFDRLKVSIYGLDEEEYRLMTRRDEYGQALAGISRILKHSRGNVVFGIRQLRNRPAPDVRAWVDKLAESSGCRQPIPITESVLEYRSWSRQKPRLPLDASWMAGGSPDAGAQCLIPLARPLVTSEGGLSYCHCPSFRLSGELMLGNLEEHSLRELYNSERCAELFDWQRYGVPSYCRTCSTYVPISTARFVSLFKEPWLW